MPDTARADAGARPVAGRGKMTPNGYQPENAAFIDQLTTLEGHRRVGKAPSDISLSTLTAAGHPRASAQAVVRRMNGYLDRSDADQGITLKSLRERYCYPCRLSEDSFSEGPSYSGIRNCDIVDCPVWPYRLGFNPHNPQRGIDPFAVTRRRPTAET